MEELPQRWMPIEKLLGHPMVQLSRTRLVHLGRRARPSNLRYLAEHSQIGSSRRSHSLSPRGFGSARTFLKYLSEAGTRIPRMRRPLCSVLRGTTSPNPSLQNPYFYAVPCQRFILVIGLAAPYAQFKSDLSGLGFTA